MASIKQKSSLKLELMMNAHPVQKRYSSIGILSTFVKVASKLNNPIPKANAGFVPTKAFFLIFLWCFIGV